MKKIVKQFRFYDEKNKYNSPSTLNITNLSNGEAFFSDSVLNSNYGYMISLGIQALPGTKFTINEGMEPVIVGNTGIFELDVDGYGEIFELKFIDSSLKTIAETENGYLIVDAIYKTEEANK